MASTRPIYIVDDSAGFLSLLHMVFTKFLPMYTIRFFESGQALLEELPIRPLPSLILLNRHMPELDGHRVLIHLKTNDDLKKIPVVMTSSSATEQEIEDCYKSGANSFMRKPLELASLVDALTITCRYWIEFNQSPSRQ